MSYREGVRTLEWSASARHRRSHARAHAHAGSISLMLTLGLLVAAAGLCFLYVQQSTALRSLTAQCEDTRQALAEVREISAALAYDIDRTFSLQRIADFARNRLGMIEPTIIRYVQRTHVPGS